MRGVVSVEYVLILLASAGLYYGFVNHFLGFVGFSTDVEHMVKARYDLLSLHSVGSFLSTSQEGNAYLFLQEVNGTIHTNPLRADVELTGTYSSCGSPCEVRILTSPFKSDESVSGMVKAVKDASGVRVE